MRRVVFGAVTAAVMTTLGSAEAGAQDSGWWDWALAEQLEARYDSRDDARRPDRYERDRPDGDRRDRYDRERRDRRDRYDRGRRDRDRRDRYDRGRRDRYDRYGARGDYLSASLIEIILGRRGDGRIYRRDGRRDRRGKGPAFCRNGRGHPVHGRSWCRRKGWDGYGRRPVIWQRRGGWGDIILRQRHRPRTRVVIIDRRGLVDILGEVILRRLLLESRLDYGDHLTGRWMTPYGGASVLQIRSGLNPVAELTDADGDGRVDAVLMPGT